MALRRDRRRLGGRARRAPGDDPAPGRPHHLRPARHLARLIGHTRDARHHGDVAAEHAGAGVRDGRRHRLGDGVSQIRARLADARRTVRRGARRARAGDGARTGHRRERARDRSGSDRAPLRAGGRAAARLRGGRCGRTATAARRGRPVGAAGPRVDGADRGIRRRRMARLSVPFAGRTDRRRDGGLGRAARQRLGARVPARPRRDLLLCRDGCDDRHAARRRRHPPACQPRPRRHRCAAGRHRGRLRLRGSASRGC